MHWIALSLLTAFAAASQDAWTKKFFGHLNLYGMVAYPLVYSLPFLAVALLLIPVPGLDGTFWWCLLVSIPLNAAAFVLYMQAIRMSPLSLTLPYLAFTPTFILLTGYIFLGERSGAWGIAGVVITCAGSYVLNIDPRYSGITAPVRAVLREPGSWIMLVTAFLYSFAAVIGKKGMLHSSPLFFAVAFFTALNTGLLVLFFAMKKISWEVFSRYPARGLFVGCLLMIHMAAHAHAITMAQAAYMIALKRTSILFGILYGAFLFRESHTAVRFWGASLMLAGAMTIALKGG